MNSLVIQHPEATFFTRVEGDSMQDEGITEGEFWSRTRPCSLSTAVWPWLMSMGGLKRVRMVPDRSLLVPANPKYPTIEITAENDFSVWGVERRHAQMLEAAGIRTAWEFTQ